MRLAASDGDGKILGQNKIPAFERGLCLYKKDWIFACPYFVHVLRFLTVFIADFSDRQVKVLA
jgi:hypothetical protein